MKYIVFLQQMRQAVTSYVKVTAGKSIIILPKYYIEKRNLFYTANGWFVITKLAYKWLYNTIVVQKISTK